MSGASLAGQEGAWAMCYAGSMGTLHRLLALAAPLAVALQPACTPLATPPPAATAALPPPAKTPGDPEAPLVAARSDKGRTKDEIVVQLQTLERLALATPAGTLEQIALGSSVGARERPMILRRLAEGYVELESIGLRDQIAGELRADAARPRKPSDTADRSAAAERAGGSVAGARRGAIKNYQELATSYPTFCVRPGVQCGDEVLYYLAYEHEQDQHNDEARRSYQELIKKFPESKFLPNAYLFFGERLFVESQSDPSQLSLAVSAYRKAAEAPPPENQVWGYAHYKLAFVYWNQGDMARALAEFQQVIEFGTKFASLPNAEKLGAMARRDILPVYALVGDPGKAFDFFKPLSGDPASETGRALAMSVGLGKQYLDTGHYKECVLLDLDLLRRAPGEPSCAPLAQLDQAMARVGPADAAALRAALDKNKKLVEQARGVCVGVAVGGPPDAVRRRE